MDLSLSETEEYLATYVRSFVRREAPTETLVALQKSELGHRQEWTSKMADAGWLGALVPSDCGGGDATCLQAAVIWEELGRAPLPGPYFVSSVLAALLLRSAEPSAQRDEVLAAIATGEAIVVPVLGRPEQDWSGLRAADLLTLAVDGEISGTFPYVPYAQAATHFLLPFQAGDGPGVGFGVLSAKAPRIGVRRLPGFLAWNYELSLSGTPLDQDVIRCDVDQVSQALAKAYALLAAYAVGGCQALLERSVDYSSTRVQFGRAIGRFQRVQDHIVELVNGLDAARWVTYEALWRIDSGRDGRAGAHMAKAVASESYITCTDAAHKVHGGIGVDPDYGLTLYSQMARSLYGFLGRPRWHKRQMVGALGWMEQAAGLAPE